MRYLITLALAALVGSLSAAQPIAPEFDFNLDGRCDIVDATLAARYMMGFTGATLVVGLLPNASPAEILLITTTIAETIQVGSLELNGDSTLEGTSDGLLFIRYALGLTNTALTSGVKTGSRDAAQIKTYLDTKCGAQISPFPWPVWTGITPAVPPSATGNTWYVDGTNGSDSNNGRTPTTAFKTIGKVTALDNQGASILAAGDSVLIRKGLYREGIILINGPGGTAVKPITFGSYGDGEVILDGSQKVGPWVRVGTTGSVWRVANPFGPTETPIMVVVNEVPLKQLPQGDNAPGAPIRTVADVTSGSGKWFHDPQFITADMGSADPNTADLIVQKATQDVSHIYFYDKDYLRFAGLTIRGSSSNGLWGYGSHITVEQCNVKFNSKSGISFQAIGGKQASDNAVVYSHVYHNVLSNWPRGNSGYAVSGGGWPGALGWAGNLRPLARGNIVHMNGGEGIISYGSSVGVNTGSALFDQNVSYDNWSVNMYFDNQPTSVARNNLIFNHPVDYNLATTNFIYVGSPFPYDQLGKYNTCLLLADEQNSSDSTNGYANLDASRVYNNLLAGCRIGIGDYGEGAITSLNHGLKNTLIANNTIIMPSQSFPNTGGVFGMLLQDNTSPSGINKNTRTVIANNLVVGYNNDFLIYSKRTGAITGITLKNNLYWSNAAKPFGSGDSVVATYDLAGWKTNTANETNSVFANPQLENAAHFQSPGTHAYLYRNAIQKTGSPAIGAGTSAIGAFTGTYTVDFALQPRDASIWNMGAF